jgi:hypothetical protein
MYAQRAQKVKLGGDKNSVRDRVTFPPFTHCRFSQLDMRQGQVQHL